MASVSRYTSILLPLLSLIFITSQTPLELQTSRTTLQPLASSTEPAQFFSAHHSQRRKLSYGPFPVPDMSINSGMIDYETLVASPCPGGDCLITWMRAGLEYPNGTEANANTGLWLHHVVMYNLARQSAVCAHVPRQGKGGFPEAMFASGNERTAIDICVNGTNKAGYQVHSTDRLGLVLELMNMTPQPLNAVLTLTMEFIPGPLPSGFSPTTPLWLDIGSSCPLNSDRPAFANTTFQYTSPVFVNRPGPDAVTGKLAFVAAHLHDGGTHLNVRKNGRVICDAVAHYGQTPQYVSPAGMGMNVSLPMSMPMDPDMGPMEHVSSISACTDDGVLSAGDTMSVTAFYDTNLHAPMTDMNGQLEPIMGISIVYVATRE